MAARRWRRSENSRVNIPLGLHALSTTHNDTDDALPAEGKPWTDISSSYRSLYNSSSSGVSDRLDNRSVASWAYEDELDRQASRAVQDALDTIDGALFEDTHQLTALPGPLQQECDEWRTTFVHLRVSGRQLLPSRDSGFQFIAMPPPAIRSILRSPPSGPRAIEIEGRAMPIHPAPAASPAPRRARPPTRSGSGGVDADSVCSHGESGCGVDEEETLAAHGDAEEVFAIDASGPDESVKRAHPSYPPLTPRACEADTIRSQVFDDLWGDVIASLRPALARLAQPPPARHGQIQPALLHSPSRVTLGESLGDFGDMDLRRGVRKAPLQTPSRPLSSPGVGTKNPISRLATAITIKPLPLQRRDSVHSVSSDSSQTALDEDLASSGPYAAFRPARGVSGRPETYSRSKVPQSRHKLNRLTVVPEAKPDKPPAAQQSLARLGTPDRPPTRQAQQERNAKETDRARLGVRLPPLNTRPAPSAQQPEERRTFVTFVNAEMVPSLPRHNPLPDPRPASGPALDLRPRRRTVEYSRPGPRA